MTEPRFSSRAYHTLRVPYDAAGLGAWDTGAGDLLSDAGTPILIPTLEFEVSTEPKPLWGVLAPMRAAPPNTTCGGWTFDRVALYLLRSHIEGGAATGAFRLQLKMGIPCQADQVTIGTVTPASVSDGGRLVVLSGPPAVALEVWGNLDPQAHAPGTKLRANFRALIDRVGACCEVTSDPNPDLFDEDVPPPP